MEILSPDAFKALIDDKNAMVLSTSPQGPKVLQKQNRDIVKLFYRTKWLSSDTWFPKALRFNYNSQRLRTAGFLAPEIKKIFYYPGSKAHILIYNCIPGKDFRELTQHSVQYLEKLPPFLALLHEKGIFYRGIHLGNLILSLYQTIALIDITDVKSQDTPLTLQQRAKNLAHLMHYRLDNRLFQQYGYRHFLQEYAEHAALNAKSLKKLRSLIARRLKRKRR